MDRSIRDSHESSSALGCLDFSFSQQLSDESTKAFESTRDSDLGVDFDNMLASASDHEHLNFALFVTDTI